MTSMVQNKKTIGKWTWTAKCSDWRGLRLRFARRHAHGHEHEHARSRATFKCVGKKSGPLKCARPRTRCAPLFQPNGRTPTSIIRRPPSDAAPHRHLCDLDVTTVFRPCGAVRLHEMEITAADGWQAWHHFWWSHLTRLTCRRWWRPTSLSPAREKETCNSRNASACPPEDV